MTSTLARYRERIGDLEGQVARLRAREVAVREALAAKQAQLDRATAQLDRARQRLAVARSHLKRSLVVLRERLVAIYESGQPDLVSVLLASSDYSDLATRSEYLTRIREADEGVVERVRDLRDEVRQTVEGLREARLTIETARDTIARHETTLVAAREAAEAHQAQLVSVRASRERALTRVEHHVDRFGSRVQAIQQQIAEQINQSSSSAPLAAGPPAPGSASSGLAWPVQGVLTSGFGPRWGSFHPGIDIGVAEGTPIHAAASGTVVLLQSEAESGGYGNYTCVDHGGGLSTCYAHQTSFATSAGATVVQGEVIGYVGNTGFSTGPHLHFEVRVGGEPQDPMAYL
ncbi:MAG: peptidoglycan DD-metalloendopeptidase family protein [Solirubrobacterales bacterium]